MENREQITHHCPLCGHEADRAGFHRLRGIGTVCASCVERRTGKTVAEWQRESWNRGNPRGA